MLWRVWIFLAFLFICRDIEMQELKNTENSYTTFHVIKIRECSVVCRISYESLAKKGYVYQEVFVG